MKIEFSMWNALFNVYVSKSDDMKKDRSFQMSHLCCPQKKNE